MALLGMELVQELVESVFLTSQLSTDPPVSLLLIAKPESGKTSIVLAESSEEAVICSDASGGGITSELIQNQKAGHIIINDMVAVMAHKESVNKRTMAILNAMIEEGLYKIALPGSGFWDFRGRKVGVVCCIPDTMVMDERRWWNASGFSSRLLPFAYRYSKELLIRIKKEILQTGVYEKRNGASSSAVRGHVKHNLAISTALAGEIQSIADGLALNLDELGLRRGKQLRALSRGNALLHHQKAVSDRQIEFLLDIKRFISFQVEEEIYDPTSPNKGPSLRSRLKSNVTKVARPK